MKSTVPVPQMALSVVCAEAAALSVKSGGEVHFKFNDVALIASPERSASQLSADYNEICRIRAEEYRNSPEGIAAAARRRYEILSKQQEVDALIRQLPTALKHGLDEAVKWIKDFTNLADDIAVKFDKAGLALSFRTYGYKTNEHVGEPKEWFNTRERIGRSLIGQVMNCLESGMPPHPRALHFCDKYFKTRKTLKTPSVPDVLESDTASYSPKEEK